jgi:DNA-binding response OmpR family regulator
MMSACDARRVLLIEDEFVIALMIEELLKGAGFVVVGPALRLDAAVHAARGMDIDAALLDVHRADQPVFPVAEVLAERGIPFIFVAARRGPDAMPAKFKDRPYIDMPFLPAHLLEVLSKIAGRAA